MENREDNGGDFRFGKSSRLKKSREFRAVVSSTRPKKTGNFVVYQAKNAELGPRLGISVGAGVGCGVVRNRVKRRLREFFRVHKDRFRDSSDTVIIAKKGASVLSLKDIEKELSFLAGGEKV